MAFELGKTSSQEQELHIKYRPQTLEEVYGQEATIRSLGGLMEDGGIPRSLLLSGPSGTGKTTIAGILANTLGVTKDNFMVVDCATSGGIDSMRELMQNVSFKGFGEASTKLLVLDECHQITKAAQNSLLINLENIPDHLYIVLCTTEPAKLIKTIHPRCQHYKLTSLKNDDIIDLLEDVCEEENIDLDEKCLSAIARESEGGARQALVNLQKCQYAEDLEDVKRMLDTAEGTIEGIELCRLLMKGPDQKGYSKAVKIIKTMPEVPPESVRLMVVNYFARIAMGGSNVRWALHIIDCFSGEIYNPSEKYAPVLLALADVYEE